MLEYKEWLKKPLRAFFEDVESGEMAVLTESRVRAAANKRQRGHVDSRLLVPHEAAKSALKGLKLFLR